MSFLKPILLKIDLRISIHILILKITLRPLSVVRWDWSVRKYKKQYC